MQLEIARAPDGLSGGLTSGRGSLGRRNGCRGRRLIAGHFRSLVLPLLADILPAFLGLSGQTLALGGGGDLFKPVLQFGEQIVDRLVEFAKILEGGPDLAGVAGLGGQGVQPTFLGLFEVGLAGLAKLGGALTALLEDRGGRLGLSVVKLVTLN